jgi:hypothetical protein
MADDDISKTSGFLHKVLNAPNTTEAFGFRAARLISSPRSPATLHEDSDIDDAGTRAARYLRRAVRDPEKRARIVECLSLKIDRSAARARLVETTQQLFAARAPLPGETPTLERIRFIPAEVPKASPHMHQTAVPDKADALAAIVPGAPVISVLMVRGIGFRQLQLTALRAVSSILLLECARSLAFTPAEWAVDCILKVVEPEHSVAQPTANTAWPHRIDVMVDGIHRDAIRVCG